MDEKFFKFSSNSKVDVIVVEALGVGNVPSPAFEGIKYAIIKGILGVLNSLCSASKTDDVYGYLGAGKHLHNLGVIFSDYLSGQKARIKLMIVPGVINQAGGN